MSWHDGRVQTGTGDQPPCPRRARCPVPVFSVPVPAILRQLAPPRRSLNTARPQVGNTTSHTFDIIFHAHFPSKNLNCRNIASIILHHPLWKCVVTTGNQVVCIWSIYEGRPDQNVFYFTVFTQTFWSGCVCWTGGIIDHGELMGGRGEWGYLQHKCWYWGWWDVSWAVMTVGQLALVLQKVASEGS